MPPNRKGDASLLHIPTVGLSLSHGGTEVVPRREQTCPTVGIGFGHRCANLFSKEKKFERLFVFGQDLTLYFQKRPI